MAIVASFVIGTIVTGSTVYAADKPNGQPFDAVWQAIGLLQTQIDEIELTPGPQGEQGIQGEIGPQGPAGVTPDMTQLLADVDHLRELVKKRNVQPNIPNVYALSLMANQQWTERLNFSDGDSISWTFSWVQTVGTPVANLSGENSQEITFTPVQSGEVIRFDVTVTDDLGKTGSSFREFIIW